MASKQETDSNRVSDQVISILTEGLTPAKSASISTFAQRFLYRTPQDELAARDPASWAGLIRDHFKLLQQRLPGQTTVRVFNPDPEESGWSSSHTIVQIVSGDKPFLVDSASIAMITGGVSLHLVIHPIIWIQRDQGGYLMNVYQEKTDQAGAESVMHFEVDRQTDPEVLIQLKETITEHLEDVALAVRDWTPMKERIADACAMLESTKALDTTAVGEAVEFLNWVNDDHFTLLGYREYKIQEEGGEKLLIADSDSGLGILDNPERKGEPRNLTVYASHDVDVQNNFDPLILTKTNAKARVHRMTHMDYIGVMVFDEQGRICGERRFLGLYTSSAYNRRPWNIPYIRRKVEEVMQRSEFAPSSHGSKTLLHILETIPRDELFQASAEELYQMAFSIFDLQERQQTRLLIRTDRFKRFYSCMVFIPRDRFSTETREKVQGVLKRSLNGYEIDYAVQLSESMLARLHVIVRIKSAAESQPDVREIEAKLVEAVRSWHDRLNQTLIEKFGEEQGGKWARQFVPAFPAAYVEDVSPWVAAFDVENLAQVCTPDDIHLSLYRPRRKHIGIMRFKIFRYGTTIPLSDVLPMLENLGLRIVSERPYRLNLADGSERWIQDFDMQPAHGDDLDLDQVRDHFQEAFERIVNGQLENDGFNKLILLAGMNWRQVAMIRAYCKYLLQTGIPFSQPYMEQTLCANPGITVLTAHLFETQFHPQLQQLKMLDSSSSGLNELLTPTLGDNTQEVLDSLAKAADKPRSVRVRAIVNALRKTIEAVSSLDQDRILRGFIGVVRATLRANYYQLDQNNQPRDYMSFKLDSGKVRELPKPRPWREIFVYSPRVEGVHLRAGKVARGGLRWSDRREDFRTEVLGLMKAQVVKNTMIVPVGAKGGFFVKQPPEGGDRQQLMAEVVACYRTFIRGLLDITDNLDQDKIVYPDDVVRHDKDDPYLVVAADKGTATFSDIANSVAESQGFWLGDAFASGGSVGYDHKGMGITAKGAWESVKRHFREMGVDCQTEPFTVVGIGDMSGDVFGNGMLLSPKIQLKAAFNHLHIFLDPDPDIEKSFAERSRLFELPRSSWEDYNPELISKGGGIFSRQAKSIPLSGEVKTWLQTDADQMAPNELIQCLLKSEVDLLWNGGIGTYVKSADETNTEVGDRANDALRVDGSELRCKVVGEGGNLGLTQKGRIEYALAGGRINSDFVDNSAGVDCSDHEVNIKILLSQIMDEQLLTIDDRNQLLAAMTDDVEHLVLRNNYLQTQAISMMSALTVDRLGSKAHFIDVLEAQGVLDRTLECLPTNEELKERGNLKIGLTRPELSVLLSYSKITLYQQLLSSDVPEDSYLSKELLRYFPEVLQQRFPEQMENHRLRREIIATAVTNSLINRMGATFTLRMGEDTGCEPSEIAKAYTTAREIFGARRWWTAIEAHDNKAETKSQTRAQLLVWNLLRHATRWILAHHRDNLDIAALVERYAKDADTLVAQIPSLAKGDSKRQIQRRTTELKNAGFDKTVSSDLAGLPALNAALDIAAVSSRTDQPVELVASLYFELDQQLELGWLMEQVETLIVTSQWHAQARSGLRDELFRHHRKLTSLVLTTEESGSAEQRVGQWHDAHQSRLALFVPMIQDMKKNPQLDYAMISVAVRGLSHLISELEG